MKHTARVPNFPKSIGNGLQYSHAATIGNRVYIRGRKSDGTPVFLETTYSPTYYLQAPPPAKATSSAVDGTPLAAFMCSNIREGREFLEKHPGHVYGDIQPEYMFLSDVYGAKDVIWNLDHLYIWNIDIEVDKDPQRGFATVLDPFNPVISITVKWKHMGHKGVVVYGVPYNGATYIPGPDITYIECATEEELLLKFLDDFRSAGDYPDIITGWNVQFFDIPYMVNRLKRLFTEETWIRMAPFSRLTERAVFFEGQEQTVIDIKGLAILDYYELYRKFELVKQENYRLDTIAHIELGERKISYAEYRSLHQLYRKDYQKFIEYNIQDVHLVDRLDDKKKLIALVVALTYMAKCNFADTFKQVRLWDIMIYHHLRSMKKVVPPRRVQTKSQQYEGAYVKEPIVGMHQWVVSFDVASMYPHIIREWNLSPETIQPQRVTMNTDTDAAVTELLDRKIDTEPIKQLGFAMAANGVLTNHQEGFLPDMLKKLYEERVRYKKQMQKAEAKLEGETDPAIIAELKKEVASCNNQQQVRKVNLNSAYGAMGSEYFRFFSVPLAEAVTITGKMVIKWIAQDLNRYLNKTFKTKKDYVIASDTDSVYLNLEPVAMLILEQHTSATNAEVVEALHQFSDKKIQPIINKSLTDIADYMHVANPCMTMVRDIIADKGVWTAKKRYILNVWDKEHQRYDEPKLKIMGIEAIKSSTPSIVRPWMKKAFKILMTGTQEELWTFLATCKTNFYKASFEDVAFSKSCNNIKKYEGQDKRVPIHVRGALTFNRMLETTKLLNSYETITEGEKIKYAYLRAPNVFGSNILSAPGGCPVEWNVEQHLDYDTQFDKAFIDPLNVILTCAKWTTEYQNTLW
jgi:DNA polymerase elongation subunit (family B)